MRKALIGESISESEYMKSIARKDSQLSKGQITIPHIKEDSILRAEIDLEDKYSIHQAGDFKLGMVFCSPLKGNISQRFNPGIKHYGIDIVGEKSSPILSIADGTVIFVEWTLETGYAIVVEHGIGFLSVYKHNESILKEQGDLVKFGEVIANMGNTGEYTTGPHLHFEIWKDGVAINPEDYISFGQGYVL
ncbi:peptidase family M23 [Elysia marginata]|uniref:Peptidase family M23 n=1 Tax=Elysia marginata TaxID=1093978 RepID=A0AAV4G477_9GAST|nr:peptidase family M23 [Elysia marginata]